MNTICSTGSPRQQQISETARARLVATGRFQNCNLRCEVHDTEVILRGRVASWYDKQMAQEALRPISDSVQVQNLLEVTAHGDLG